MVQVWVTSIGMKAPNRLFLPAFFLRGEEGIASSAEQAVSGSLRVILAELPSGTDIPDTEQFRWALSGLERFLPDVLAEVYAEWNSESLDGIYPVQARRIGGGEAEIFGQCILISDQTLTPLHLRLQLSPVVDEISWLECRIGERGKHGMVRMPYDRLNANFKRLYLLDGRADMIDWVYKVTFGRRRM
jgi:hypothetical protein